VPISYDVWYESDARLPAYKYVNARESDTIAGKGNPSSKHTHSLWYYLPAISEAYVVETRSSTDMAAGSASKTRRAILVLFIWAVAMLFFMAALQPNGKLIDLVCIYTKEFTTTLKKQ